MTKKIVCIVCPRGCELTVEGDPVEGELSVSGAACARGVEYGRAEVRNPVRVLTATVAVTGGMYPRCPVKSRRPLPKGLLFKAMEELSPVILAAPVHAGQVVAENICGSGVDIIATRALA